MESKKQSDINVKKFDSNQSVLILTSILEVLKVSNGISNLDAIKYCVRIFDDNKRVQDLLVQMKKEINEGMLASDAFEKYGLLSSIEAEKYKSYKDERHVIIKKIIDGRKHINRFEPPLKSLYRRVFFSLCLIVGILYFSSDYLIKTISDKFLEKGIKNPEDHIPFFLTNMELNLVILAVVFSFGFLIKYYYLHLYNNDRKQLYSYFPIKQYDDLPDMFDTMHNYHKGLGSTSKVFSKMAILKPYRGLKEMFESLEKATTQKELSFYWIFSDYKISKRITEYIAIIDDKDILSHFDKVSDLAKGVGEEKFAKYLMIVGAISNYFPYFLVSSFFIYVSYLTGGLDYTGMLNITSVGMGR